MAIGNSALLFPAIGAIGLLFLLGGSSKASSATAAKPRAAGPTPKPGAGGGAVPTKQPATALDYQTRIADAIGRNDTDGLLKIANDMQASGLTNEANALRVVALNLKQLNAGGTTLTPSTAIPNPPIVVVAPPIVVGPSSYPLPAGTPAAGTVAQTFLVAQAMAVDLRNTSRYKENQTLVRTFQQQEGLVIDGKYGPKSALALAGFGIIPPRPRYWVAKSVKADKVAYTAEMLTRAASDPSRAADWTAASKVQNDPVG